jgi:hypothetical protein
MGLHRFSFLVAEAQERLLHHVGGRSRPHNGGRISHERTLIKRERIKDPLARRGVRHGGGFSVVSPKNVAAERSLENFLQIGHPEARRTPTAWRTFREGNELDALSALG